MRTDEALPAAPRNTAARACATIRRRIVASSSAAVSSPSDLRSTQVTLLKTVRSWACAVVGSAEAFELEQVDAPRTARALAADALEQRRHRRVAAEDEPAARLDDAVNGDGEGVEEVLRAPMAFQLRRGARRTAARESR